MVLMLSLGSRFELTEVWYLTPLFFPLREVFATAQDCICALLCLKYTLVFLLLSCFSLWVIFSLYSIFKGSSVLEIYSYLRLVYRTSSDFLSSIIYSQTTHILCKTRFSINKYKRTLQILFTLRCTNRWTNTMTNTNIKWIIHIPTICSLIFSSWLIQSTYYAYVTCSQPTVTIYIYHNNKVINS